MPRYAIKTTIDITRSNPTREDPDPIRHAQQNNFNTLVQGIGMRANIEWNSDPQRIEHEGDAEWFWDFETEQVDVFVDGSDVVGLLKKDLNGVPIIRNLTNTERLDKPVFITSGGDQNIWIEPI